MFGVGSMGESIYKVIELVGSSTDSWEDAVKKVIEIASKSLRDLRVAEVSELDVRLENDKIAAYRAKVKLSFKYEKEE
jgi:flavin-binding protein dodecin